MCDYERNVSECDVESSGEPLEESSGYSRYGEQDSKLTPCVNMENGLYALECTPRVLSCQDGKEEIFECPSNLVFNEKSLICDYPETSQKCQLEETLLIRDAPMATYDCEVDGLFSVALCSREYHKCSDGQLIKHQCAEPNSVFSAVDGECVDFSTLSQCH
ncbi:Protein CBG05213 [Caenorhabditis briggsae]|nr:Protein CBG05213 [Caenorhabditis briggsae]CAP25755.2 Protein CBG05213 [Caenorhabditis briggsae]